MVESEEDGSDLLLNAPRMTLSFGISVSWVTVENRLSGVIIAARDYPPAAYMLPIEGVFDSIPQCIGDANGTLPSNAYSEVLRLWQASTEQGQKPIFEHPELLLAVAMEANERGNGMNILLPPPNQKGSILGQLEYMKRSHRPRGTLLHLEPLGVSHELIDLLIILAEDIHISLQFATYIRSAINGHRQKIYTRKYSLSFRIFLKQFLQIDSGVNTLALLLTPSHAVEATAFGSIVVRLLETFGCPQSIIPAAPKFKIMWQLCVVANIELNLDIKWAKDSLNWGPGFNYPSLHRPHRQLLPLATKGNWIFGCRLHHSVIFSA
ncbi:MAG: hypothetical protein MMC33_006213 [Icmadophila ericetorum]|nr:hypothetical protein [Icmadophila ericetorum]